VYAQKEVEHPEYCPSSFGIFLKVFIVVHTKNTNVILFPCFFLQYVNSDNLCFAESHVCDLLRIAFVYEIPHIMNKCREFAIATLSLENVLKFHLAAMLYELEDLQAAAFRFFLK
jgi:hypothetical protein